MQSHLSYYMLEIMVLDSKNMPSGSANYPIMIVIYLISTLFSYY
jgi:hypothetical protein